MTNKSNVLLLRYAIYDNEKMLLIVVKILIRKSVLLLNNITCYLSVIFWFVSNFVIFKQKAKKWDLKIVPIIDMLTFYWQNVIAN